MEKSIETIWSKGFLNTEDLKAPKINDLYNRKSELLIEKMKKTYTIDNNSLCIAALVIGISFSLFGHYLVAIYGVCITIGLFFFNRHLLSSLETININLNSYDYLLTYKESIRKIIKTNTKILVSVFPIVMMVGYYLFFRNTEKLNTFITNHSNIQIIGFSIALAVFLAILGVSVYYLSTKLIYGRHLNRLDDIIADMKALRNSTI